MVDWICHHLHVASSMFAREAQELRLRWITQLCARDLAISGHAASQQPVAIFSSSETVFREQ